MDAPVPVIDTERLVLRGWRPSDFEAHAAVCADPEAQRFVGGPLAERLGMRRLPVDSHHGTPVVTMALDRPGAPIGPT